MISKFTPALLLLWSLGGHIRSAEAEPVTTVTSASPVTSGASVIPKGLERKHQITPKTLAEKRQGGYFTGFPIVNSDPDKGVGYGARIIYYYNGKNTSPFFKYAPYFHRIYAQYYRTTRGFQVHAIKSDSPYIGDTLFRVRIALAYERDIAANFFGTGNETLDRLRRSDQSITYAKVAPFEKNNRRIIDGKTYARYDKFEIIRPRANINLERDILGGVVRPLIGFQVTKISIHDFTGDTIVVDGDKAMSRPTRLFEEHNRRKISGFGGGWNNNLKLGIAYDTRDFEPAPTRGAFYDLSYEASHRNLGSDFNYNRESVGLRYYYSPAPKLADLVLAGRAFYQVQNGNVPFFEMGTLVFTQGNDTGLGGLRSLRGFVDNRFIGPVLSLANLEARWTFFKHTLWGQDFAHSAAPFVDTGRVYDKISETTLRDWKVSGGAGYRIAWNQATIVLFDYGFSSEGNGVYINFGHMF